LKTAYRDQVEQLNQGGIDAIGKEHFTSLYKPAREKALTRKNIMAGWAATGLHPFQPERVLAGLPKPAPSLIVSKAHAAAVSSLQEEVPQTPITPVTVEALTSLHDMIKQDAHAQDAKSKQRLQKHVQQLASAAQISFAERALLQDQNRFLFKVNSEAKVRRSTRSVVLGRAKVMSFGELEEARSKRAAKDKTTAAKQKRGRKRKSSAVEDDAAPPVLEDDEVQMVESLELTQPGASLWRAPYCG
jgi:hypothetical protein